MDRIKALIDSVTLQNFYNKQLSSVIDIPSVAAKYSSGTGLSPAIAGYLRSCGIEDLYTHQAEAIKRLRLGNNVIITTPTASGKTLGFNIPVLEKIAADKDATALYIYPAKALSNDQLGVLNEMKKASGINFEAGIYDGDTDAQLKRHLRENANIIITNPYELHQILPFHPKWKHFYKNLKFIVIDEAHRYKGIFGSNIAFLLRRLKRVLKVYNAGPQFIASTASIASPLEFIEKLTGEKFTVVDKNGAPSGEKHLVLWDPSTYPERSVHTQTKDLLLYSARSGCQTLAFVTSRRLSELIRRWANQQDSTVKILSYRAGYSPKIRRDIESKLKKGEIKGVVSTNALELGIDIGQLDVIIISGYPGSISSFWQQAGRAGRKMQDSAVFYIPSEDAMQKYILRHPDILTSRNFESALISTNNPNIIAGHVLCAISEVMAETTRIFDDVDTEPFVETLIEKGLVSRTPRGLIYAGSKRPQDVVGLDSIGSSNIKIKIDGKILEEVSLTRAYEEAHTGAVHIFNGETYVIKELNLEEGTATAVKEEVEHYTEAVKDEEVKILKIKKSKDYPNFTLHFGNVSVTETYKSYKTKKFGKVLSYDDLFLPPLTFSTEAVWFEIAPQINKKVKDCGLDFDGAIHAAEHALIALSPLWAMCDRNDIGGRSYPVYEDGNSVIFIYDGYDGGIGISEKLFDIFPSLISNTRDMVKACECEQGCPYCVYSPKCGNNNNPIDKQGAIVILNELI
jgi:DEAD/DEAH box helicase domain-containing protein